MTGFIKIAAADVVPESVTVQLRLADDGAVLGRVTTIGTGQGGDEEVSTAEDDPPVEFALRLARELATAKGLANIDILDPDDLWTERFGRLER